MITNARGYQITRAQLARLMDALAAGEREPPPEAVHPDIYKAELAGLQVEVDRLAADIAVYEDLVAGRKVKLDAANLDDLPSALIQARIANHWSQKQLAERLELHEQQIQRYESSRYHGVSFERLLEIANVLGVQVEQTVVFAAPALRNGMAHLRKIGFSEGFLSERILAEDIDTAADTGSLAGPALERLCRTFGWKPEQLSGTRVPKIPVTATGAPLYKLPQGRDAAFVEAYTAYAYRVACGAVRCATHLPRRPIPLDAREARFSQAGL